MADKHLLIKKFTFNTDQTLIVRGLVNVDATRFVLDISPNDREIALHVNPRFTQYNVVFNSLKGGQWGKEHVEPNNPFRLGEEFEISVTFTTEEFHVTLPDGSVVCYPNCFRESEYSTISIHQDARLTGIEIKGKCTGVAP